MINLTKLSISALVGVVLAFYLILIFELFQKYI
jgi:hypothetical protein